MKMFQLNDVVSLLQEEVKRVGGQTAFAKTTGINRTELNKVLAGVRLPSRNIIRSLGLVPIYVFEADLPRTRNSQVHGRGVTPTA